MKNLVRFAQKFEKHKSSRFAKKLKALAGKSHKVTFTAVSNKLIHINRVPSHWISLPYEMLPLPFPALHHHNIVLIATFPFFHGKCLHNKIWSRYEVPLADCCKNQHVFAFSLFLRRFCCWEKYLYIHIWSVNEVPLGHCCRHQRLCLRLFFASVGCRLWAVDCGLCGERYLPNMHILRVYEVLPQTTADISVFAVSNILFV